MRLFSNKRVAPKVKGDLIPGLEIGEGGRRESGRKEVKEKARNQVESGVEKSQEKATGTGMDGRAAADSQGATNKLKGGNNVETLFGKIFIGINFFQNFGLVGLMEVPWPER